MIRRIGLWAAVAVAGIGTMSAMAFAADMPVKAPPRIAAVDYGWGGLYVGAGVGFRSTTSNPTVTAEDNGGQTAAAFCPTQVPFGGCVSSVPMNDTAFRVSPYIGYNWQLGARGIVGVEADAGFASRTTTVLGMRYPHSIESSGIKGDTFSLKTSWDASLRARGGVLVDPAVLLYATAGIAWLHIETTSTCETNPGIGTCRTGLFQPAVITHATTRTGWTVGGGIEAMLWPNWIARAEYRYADFGTASFTGTRAVAGTTRITSYDVDLRTHTATFGLAYKLGGAGPGAGAMAAFASAAPAASWSGFYVGGSAGVRSTQVDWKVTADEIVGPSCVGFPTPPGPCFSEPMNNTAFRVGPYAGFNWQAAPRWLVGLEADVGWANKTTTIAGMEYPTTQTFTAFGADSIAVKTTWDASLRARVGFLARPALLLFATGGPAWLHVESTSTCSTVASGDCQNLAAFGPAVIKHATTKSGWTAGGGIEAMLGRNWLARGEYRYADFGTIRNTDVRANAAGVPQEVISYDLRVKSHTATFGLAYKFDWSGPF